MKSDVARVVFIVFAVLYQPCPQVYADFVANSASDSTLASKFAPVLVLTKNPTRPGREVLRPEPVEIMGAESLWNVYFSVWTADGNSLSQNGRTPVQWRELENLLGSQGFANVNFADNKFAYLGMDSPTELGGEWVSPHFFLITPEKTRNLGIESMNLASRQEKISRIPYTPVYLPAMPRIITDLSSLNISASIHIMTLQMTMRATGPRSMSR